MSLFSKVIDKPTPGVPKGIAYSLPGVGKTTFGASIPNHLILDCENGAGAVKCQRTPYLETWEEICTWLEAVEKESHNYKVLVVDTLDWLVRRAEEHVTGAAKGQMAASLMKSHGGYGAGRDVLKNYIYRVLLPQFDRIINKGIAVILLAHANRTEITDADGISVEKTVPDLPPLVLNTFLEWSDFICLANKDVEGKRFLVTSETNKAIAKNRYNMPPVIPFTWGDFSKSISAGLNAKFKN